MIREINPSANICVCFNKESNTSYKMISKDFAEVEKQSANSFLKKIDVNPIIVRNAIIGPHRNIIIESSEKNICSFGIEFKTSASNRFFGKEIKNLTDNIIPLDITNMALSRLADIVSKCTMENLFNTVDNYLINKYLPYITSKTRNECLLELINEVSDNPFDANIDIMANKLHTCQRNFERLFKQYTGLTPKQFISIKKINKVIERMIEHQRKNLVEILESCGYYDQAHINRDFKIIGGLSATQIFQNIKNRLTSSPDVLCLNYDIDGVCGFNLLM